VLNVDRRYAYGRAVRRSRRNPTMIQDARPFLPEPDPDPAPVKPKQAKKTLLLWGLLIVMFLVIWQVLQPSPSSQSTRPEPVTAPCEDTWSFGRATLVLGPILFSVFFVSWIVRAYGSARTFNREADPGLVALAERRLSVAAETFEALAAKHAKKPGPARSSAAEPCPRRADAGAPARLRGPPSRRPRARAGPRVNRRPRDGAALGR